MQLFISSGRDFLEVVDEHVEAKGYFTITNLHEAIEKGRINEEISGLMSTSTLSRVQPELPNSSDSEYTRIISSDAFTEIINSSYDGIYITDGNGITLKVNKAYERITGIEQEQLVGFHMDDLVKAGYISKSVSTQVIKEKRPITMMQTLHNKRNVIVSGTPIYDKNKKVLYVINNVRDITELIHLKHEIEDLQEIRNLQQSSRVLNSDGYDLDSIIQTDETKKVYELAMHVAKTDVKVLLFGETGVGKTLIAKYIHKNSTRSTGSFIEVNCGAFPANLIEAELFGYEPGAFTGASAKGKKGLLEIADQGTLFLDEIGDLPLELQVKLLKVIDEQKFIPVGSTKTKEVDVRFIAATHKDLKQMVKEGTFREDLFYRLSVVPITIPALRERKKELIPLIDHYLRLFNQKYEYEKTISIEALDSLVEYKWPGNIRQLMNIIERLVVTTMPDEIGIRDLPEELRDLPPHTPVTRTYIMPLRTAVEHLERDLIKRALKKYRTTRKAADALQVSQGTIVQKMKKWNLSD
ncbi:PAS domain S-box protein [Mesobacillus subterraneus]|uniref:HTH-type transcriptional regulatory protein TyrR n=2 Tax=Mesobacillus subterraneus TaxID=285983 RepID=A0A427TWU5_9BACI|nr:PAS domain S-box protein [Mesobacillus subterraneus]